MTVKLEELSPEMLTKIEAMLKAQKLKEERDAAKNLPGFSFRIEMKDGESVIWSGKAVDEDSAWLLAKEKAESENASGILDSCRRLYQPKGRKPAVDPVKDSVEGGNAEEEQAA